MLLLGIGLGFVGARCGSPSSSPAEDSETVTAWTVERPRLGEHLRVEDIEPADLGDCIEARYRVVLTR
jgi:hypothetical protein